MESTELNRELVKAFTEGNWSNVQEIAAKMREAAAGLVAALARVRAVWERDRPDGMPSPDTYMAWILAGQARTGLDTNLAVQAATYALYPVWFSSRLGAAPDVRVESIGGSHKFVFSAAGTWTGTLSISSPSDGRHPGNWVHGVGLELPAELVARFFDGVETEVTS